MHTSAIRERIATAALTTHPVRHIVIDNLLDEAVARRLSAGFPEAGPAWRRLESMRERKSALARVDDPQLSALIDVLQSDAVSAIVRERFGFASLAADPTLYAGGLSLMGRGDFLNPHIDNSHDANRRRYRRVNLLLYLTPEWSERDGGCLELWDQSVKRNVSIAAYFNRAVLMETNRTSWHSVRTIESENWRQCVSVYYFSEESPDGSDYYHVTSFAGRPHERIKRMLAPVDNLVRQGVARLIGFTRGRHHLR